MAEKRTSPTMEAQLGLHELDLDQTPEELGELAPVVAYLNQTVESVPDTPQVAPELTEAVENVSPHPWLDSLQATLDQLNSTVAMCQTVMAMREAGELPNVSLYVADPNADLTTGQPVNHFVMPWSEHLQQIPPSAIEVLLWLPLQRSLRNRIAKLMLDVAELSQFVALK